MRILSWIVGTPSSWFWDDANFVLGIAVTVSVFGESIAHLIPNGKLPGWLQSKEAIDSVGKWSTWILVVALGLEVPVGMVRDHITKLASISVESKLIDLSPREHLLQGDSRKDFIDKMKSFKGQKVETRFCHSPSPQSFSDPPYFIDDEAIGLSMLLSTALNEAGWDSPREIAINCQGSGGTGVYVVTEPIAAESTKNAASALRAELTALPIIAVGEGRTPEQFAQEGPNGLETVVVIVLSKPR